MRSYLELFRADTRSASRVARTETRWMELLPTWPHLVGAVWRGTATRLSDGPTADPF